MSENGEEKLTHETVNRILRDIRMSTIGPSELRRHISNAQRALAERARVQGDKMGRFGGGGSTAVQALNKVMQR